MSLNDDEIRRIENEGLGDTNVHTVPAPLLDVIVSIIEKRRLEWEANQFSNDDGHTPFCNMKGHGPLCGPCDHHCRGCVYQAEQADMAWSALSEAQAENERLKASHELMATQFRTMQKEKEHGWREAEKWEVKYNAALAEVQRWVNAHSELASEAQQINGQRIDAEAEVVRIRSAIEHALWNIGDEYDKDGDLGLVERFRALLVEANPVTDPTGKSE